LNEKKEDNKLGSINVSNEIIANIVGAAVTEIDGVVSLSGGVADGIAEFLRKKDYSKGIDLEINDGKIRIDISVILEFGLRIPDIAWKIQQNVKRRIEEMTDLSVSAVNVLVRGVELKNE